MRTPRRPERALGVIALAAVGASALLAGGGSGGTTVARPTPASWQGLVGSPRPQTSNGQRMIVVLNHPSLAQRLAQAGGTATEVQERAWTSAAFASQSQLVAALTTLGVFVRPEYSYARVLNGFSAALDSRAVAMLERSPDVAGVYPVRAAYPASISSSLLRSRAFRPGQGRRADVELPGFDGRGVTIALLDTGVERSHEFLRGRVQDGYDILGATDRAIPQASPEDPARIETHGTEMAGLLVGAGGPSGLAGVATGASVLPIRVAGWQPDAHGHYAVYARSDQLLAGLERAVDPNEDGDAHDGARVALIPLAQPFAAFPDSPEARAIAGALDLDTLVVVPAGNDGISGPGFGSIAGPGGAAAALTVGAADTRRGNDGLRVVLRRGLDVEYDRVAPLLNVVPGASSRTLHVAAPRVTADAGAPILRFFDLRGYSLVAGKAAVAPAGEDPAAVAEAAAHAGAAAVVLYGRDLPPGSLGLDEDVRVPVVTVPAEAALSLLAAQRLGADASVSIGRLHPARNPDAGRIAEFSSRGLAFDARVKPELAAPGVGLATAEPGAADDGSPRFATVNGTSVAAAVTAGAAALLAQARPGLGAAELKGLLVGTGRRLEGAPTLAQGAGRVDVGAAAAAEVTAAPASLGFGAWKAGKWTSTRYVTVENVSTRRVHVAVTARPEGGESEVLSFAIEPARFLLLQGRSRTIRITARTAAPPTAQYAAGTLSIGPEGGQQVRVPWAIDFDAYRGPLLGDVRLSDKVFAASDTAPAVLSARVGKVVADGKLVEIQPVARLDVRLLGPTGQDLGLLARVRDLLPGRYDFGLTGRDSIGTKLAPGNYRLRLDAFPVAPGRPTRSTVTITIQ